MRLVPEILAQKDDDQRLISAICFFDYFIFMVVLY